MTTTTDKEGKTMTTTDEYNGWTNRETWAMALHLSNDYGLYHWTLDTVRQGLESRAEWLEDNPGLADPDNDGANWAGDHLSTQLELFMGDEAWFMDAEETATMLRDIGSWWRIDWAEVARSFMDDQ
jgi:hypothetical protein